jgi:hypothetical protein
MTPDQRIWLSDLDGPVLSLRAINCLIKADIHSFKALRTALETDSSVLRWTPGLGQTTYLELLAASGMPPPSRRRR